MGKKALALAVGALLMSTGAGSAAGAIRWKGIPVVVTPKLASPTSAVAVSFRAPERTGRFGVISRTLEVLVGGRYRRQCVSNATRAARFSRRGVRLTVTLDPGASGARWCPGVFYGTVEEIWGPSCQPQNQCPALASRMKIVGRFRFRVLRRPGAHG